MAAFTGMLKFQLLVKAVIVIVTSHSPVVSQSRVNKTKYAHHCYVVLPTKIIHLPTLTNKTVEKTAIGLHFAELVYILQNLIGKSLQITDSNVQIAE